MGTTDAACAQIHTHSQLNCSQSLHRSGVIRISHETARLELRTRLIACVCVEVLAGKIIFNSHKISS